MKYAIGDTICDDYVVKLPLGEGGMGEVYLVEHSGSGDLRAAKVMRIRDDASADDLAAFRQEAVSLLNVGTHPFIVRLFDVREREKDIVLVMEYVAPTSGCTTVGDFIVRKQDYSDRLLGAWAVQFCVGMERAIASGMVAHRDVKPENLMIDSGASLKIADFGLALAVSRHRLVDGTPKALSHLQWLEAADWRRTCGTPGYIAPEMFFGAKASQQSDMFSFGVPAVLVVAVLRPFRGATAVRTTVHSTPPPPSNRRRLAWRARSGLGTYGCDTDTLRSRTPHHLSPFARRGRRRCGLARGGANCVAYRSGA